VQDRWWKIRPLDIGWQSESHSPSRLTSSRILERHRLFRIPALRMLQLLGRFQYPVRVSSLDVLGKLGIPHRSWFPALGGLVARAAPKVEHQAGPGFKLISTCP
jgi:hypothetical protein